jgi:hypothetical protein
MEGVIGHPLLSCIAFVFLAVVGAAQLALLESVATLECLLRLRSAAVQLELAQLHRVERDVPHDAFVGRFTSVLDVSRFVLDLVGRINASIVRERVILRGSTAEEAYRSAYGIALANAEWAFGMIGSDPDLRGFLATGARAKADSVRASCQMLSLLLAVTSVGAPRLGSTASLGLPSAEERR